VLVPSLWENISTELRKTLIDQFRRHIVPGFKYVATFELMCFGPTGIDAIVTALKRGEAVDPEGRLKVRLVASPLYSIK
jgi:translation initiation factor 2 alpha subunit (eIF-2alpha)